LYILLVSFEEPWWWSQVRPKHVVDYQYVIRHFYENAFAGLMHTLEFSKCWNLEMKERAEDTGYRNTVSLKW